MYADLHLHSHFSDGTFSLTMTDDAVNANFIHVDAAALRHVPDGGDADNDGMPDEFEDQHGLNRKDAGDASLDGDGDGLSNLEEFQNGSDPAIKDHWDKDRGSGARVAKLCVGYQMDGAQL